MYKNIKFQNLTGTGSCTSSSTCATIYTNGETMRTLNTVNGNCAILLHNALDAANSNAPMTTSETTFYYKIMTETEKINWNQMVSKIQNTKSERASIANWSTVVKISIPPPSFRPVSLSLSRSSLFKTPKQVFFNPINVFDSFTTLYLHYFIKYTFFHFNVKFYILNSRLNLVKIQVVVLLPMERKVGICTMQWQE